MLSTYQHRKSDFGQQKMHAETPVWNVRYSRAINFFGKNNLKKILRYRPLHFPPKAWKVVSHHRGLRPLLLTKNSMGTFLSHKTQNSERAVRRGLRFYPMRLESLTICRCHNKGSTFSWVILRPVVLTRPRFVPATSSSAHQRLSNWDELGDRKTSCAVKCFPLNCCFMPKNKIRGFPLLLTYFLNKISQEGCFKLSDLYFVSSWLQLSGILN